jgi:hypothetical protein
MTMALKGNSFGQMTKLTDKDGIEKDSFKSSRVIKQIQENIMRINGINQEMTAETQMLISIEQSMGSRTQGMERLSGLGI